MTGNGRGNIPVLGLPVEDWAGGWGLGAVLHWTAAPAQALSNLLYGGDGHRFADSSGMRESLLGRLRGVA
jgi:hypothetical protein